MTPQPEVSEAYIHRQMESEARDIIAVKNPLPYDYKLIFDRRLYIIPASTKDIGRGPGVEHLQRFLAVKFTREATNEVLLQKGLDLVKAENARRAEGGHPALNKWEEQQTIESQVNINNPAQRQPIMDGIWLGLVQKAPEDLLLAQEQEKNENQGRTPDEQIFDALKNKVFSPSSIPEPVYTPPVVSEVLKNDLVQSLSNDTQTNSI